jgi:MFS superfamily sulfate permease-like transporter
MLKEETNPASSTRNRFDRMEWAGAFGDLGTLIPFTVAYITLLDVDPFGLLFAFGVAKIITGLYYRTPFPVQPMKAIGAIATTQAAQTLVLTHNMVYAAGLTTGIVWLLLGITGMTQRIANLIARPVILGIILGLGLSFMLDGIQMMATGWIVSTIALVGTLLLLTNRAIPVMLLLLVFGASAAVIQNPALLQELAVVEITARLPSWALAGMTWRDVVLGTLFIALPQLPLTLGNAIIAVTEENNRLFAQRRVTEKKVSISTGIMNLLAPTVGGVPMCHGAGGMAGHVRFGAQTGGALIILGALMLVLAVFFSGSIETLFKIFPEPVLGVILFLTGSQLALGTCDNGFDKNARFTTYTTAAWALWNIGIAFVFGVLIYYLLKRNIVRL